MSLEDYNDDDLQGLIERVEDLEKSSKTYRMGIMVCGALSLGTGAGLYGLSLIIKKQSDALNLVIGALNEIRAVLPSVPPTVPPEVKTQAPPVHSDPVPPPVTPTAPVAEPFDPGPQEAPEWARKEMEAEGPVNGILREEL